MPRQNKKAFTLIELLVVIAIIAILLAILMPGLKAAKKAAQGIVCVFDMRSMAMAAFFYTDDNDGKFPYPTASRSTSPPEYAHGYVRRPQDKNGNTISPMSSATFDDRVRGIEAGVMYPYTEDHKLYNCPGDRRFSLQFHNYLSYSMPGDIPLKRGQISLPDSKYIFLEESDPRPYFSGDWDLLWRGPNPAGQGWWDGLAIWHNNSSTFAFADGHAERHKWRDDYTRERAGWDYAALMARGGKYGKFPYGGNEQTYGNVRNDLDWMIARHPATKK